jgi:hypothetical protein
MRSEDNRSGERKSLERPSEEKQVFMFGKAGSATNLRVPHPSRSLRRVGNANVCIEILDPSQNARRTPDLLLRSPSMAACAAF